MLGFLLHIDQNLTYLITEFGPGAYLILFLIILLETGCIITVFMPEFSPFCSRCRSSFGTLHPFVADTGIFPCSDSRRCPELLAGAPVGLKVFREWFPEIVKNEYIDRTTRYFERFGRKTIFIGRFIPVVRTFAPFLAGIGTMDYRAFMSYNVLSALCWSVAVTGAGYLLGSIPWIREHIGLIILIILAFTLATIIVIVIVSAHGLLKSKNEKNRKVE